MRLASAPARGGSRFAGRSLYDALTGLANRFLVYDRARELLAQCGERDRSVAVLSIDIDGFSKVNHTFGQAAGDELLQVVAERLTGAVRECDMVARLGGDEFAVLVDHAKLDASPELTAAALLEVLHQPTELTAANGAPISITASVGVAYGSPLAPDDLFREADLALHEAKLSGKGRLTVFKSRMHVAMNDRLSLESELAEALDAGQFFLLYQPVFDLRSGRMTGVEALLRWRHPRRGVVAPDAFIPIAEETGLIVPIGRWALEQACVQAAAWQSGDCRLAVAVNVSTRQFERAEFVAEVRGALSQSRLPASELVLEITETVLMCDSKATVRRLRLLRALGVSIAVDDFGTGYSSLAYLHQFPVDELKIDRSFISSSTASDDAADALVHTLVQLGKALGMRMLAEGIEDVAQLRRLQREGCDRGQGFLLARPLKASAVEQLIRASRLSPTGLTSSVIGRQALVGVKRPAVLEDEARQPRMLKSA
jgi:diguanylate cyclase (GGDEF)-like protein